MITGERKCPKRYWLITYTWFGAERNFANAVIDKHPMKYVKEWHGKYKGNNDSVLLNYWEIDEETAKELEDVEVESDFDE